ncbi:MAG: alpha/beta fold hydrolase [Planctomycetota bacterium]
MHLLTLAPLLLLVTPGDEPPSKPPSPDVAGKVHRWESSDGLAFEYRVPKDYDAEVGANITFILHGSNLSRRWGFANHDAKTFRPDDIVVSPDGTTSNGNGGFNFLQGRDDLERLHALHDELRETFNVRATYLYGHSQGSFFSFYYAGAYPDDVQGLVGQASGVWIGTEAGKKHHHQAVVLMHGTSDPVVPYGQSVGGLTFYEDARYPHARLRSLDGWNHWPTQHHTSQQLAWCEAMSTEDPARIVAAFEDLDGVDEALDPVAFREVAERVLALEDVPSRTRKAAEKAVEEVDEAAGDHAAAIAKSVGKKNRGRKLEDAAWVGHAPLYFRHFRGVPACDELFDDWESTLKAHDKVAKKIGRSFWDDLEGDPADAFDAGLELVEGAFMRRATQDDEFLTKLEELADDAKDNGIGRKQQKAYDEAVPVLRSAIEKGQKAFEKVDRRYR